MERLERHAVLLALLKRLSDRGSWCGETHVQKCVYFLEQGLHVPLEFDFIFYKHGPFSFDLRRTLGEMRANLSVDVKPQPYPYGPSLVPGPSSEAMLMHFASAPRQYAKEIEFVADRFADLGVAALERLSTALFLIRESPSTSDLILARQMTQLKPHISDEAALEAVANVRRILDEARASKVLRA